MKNWKSRSFAVVLALLLAGTSFTAFGKKVGSPLKISTSQFSEEAFIDQVSTQEEGDLVLAKDGKSDYVLVYPDQTGTRLMEAVRFFQSTFQKITGASLPLRKESAGSWEKEILIGTGRDVFAKPETDTVGLDGYVVQTKGSKLFLGGAQEAGTRNAVYGFLEDTLGCLWTAHDGDYIPKIPAVYLNNDRNEVHKPAMEWRNIYAWETTQNNWFEKLRLNGLDYYSDGTVNQYAQWGTWCHSYYSFVSPEEYFDSHPEYFSLKDGKRVKEFGGLPAQLCLTNPEVYEIVKNKLAQQMKEHPEQLYWDFSVMDNSMVKGCECENCKKLDQEQGSGMGSLLPFINRLAREFPDKMISTLAYFHTIDPPQSLKAEKNVVIKLCSMPGDQASSYQAGRTGGSKAFQKRLLDWRQITDHIVVWDYVINFSHLLLPFPNFSVQRENQQFYEENHVTGVFHQASREQGGEFADLRAYILSHLLWEGKDLDVDALIGRYLTAYYGEAAPKIKAYLQSASDQLYQSGKPLGLYDEPQAHKNGYLSKKNIAQYLEWFAEAEEAVKEAPASLDRVRKAKIPLLYAKAMENSTDRKGKEKAAEELFSLCAQYGIQKIKEVDGSIEAFEQELPALIQKTTQHIYLKIGLISGGALLGAGMIAFFCIWMQKKGKKRL